LAAALSGLHAQITSSQFPANDLLCVTTQKNTGDTFTMPKKRITIEDVPSISIRDLAFKIKEVDDYIKNPKTEQARANRKPNLAFFLGAGASKDSGVILAGEMTKMFKEKIFEVHCHELETDKEKGAWLKAQGWYKEGKKEYGCLFEKFRDTKSGRQRFIEAICDKNPLTGKIVEPSFGYVVLADLLLRNYINTVVTTNFDDLVYIASTTFTGNRPIVYAYGILASEMKINAAHSKVLKLHGDYLYSNIVNTAAEMFAQSNAVKEPDKDSREIISNLNMERQVRTVLDNFGLVVVGYAGGDETVIKLLEQVSENNGFYWCYVKGFPPDADVLELVQRKNGKLVEIIGFDDMMKEISDITDFSIDDLLESFERRKENLVERITKFNEDYTKKSIGEYAVELTEKQKDNTSENLSAVDYFVLGFKAAEDENFSLAEESYRKTIELNPNYATAYNNLGNLLFKDESRLKEAEESYRKAIELNPNYANAYNNLGNLLTKDESRLKEAEESYRKAIELNLNHATAYNNLGNLLFKDESRLKEAEESYRKAIELNPNYVNAYNNLGNLLFKDESRLKEAEEKFRKAVELSPTSALTYVSLGVFLYKQNRIDEAKKIFQTSVELDKSDFNPYLGLAAIYKKQGNQKESKKYAEQAKNLLKEVDYYNLACLNSILDKKDESYNYLKLAIEKSPRYKSMAKTDPDFEWIRDDERFWEIVGRDDE
jgi:tetratricopeptide (TPR) repeat protein